MEIKKIIQEVVSRKVNEDGVVMGESKMTSFVVEREPDYVKLYIKDILRLTDIPNSGNSILFAILKRMSYNSEIALYGPVKKGIALELGIKEPTVSKAIELFANKSILLRKDRGLYIVNPFFFGRGKWEEIKKIRLEIVYSEAGRMILKALFEEKDSVKEFNDNKKPIKDDKLHLQHLEKQKELMSNLDKLNEEMAKNIGELKKVPENGKQEKIQSNSES